MADARAIHNPDVETLDWHAQTEQDDALYRKQIRYLFQRSDYYRKTLIEAGFESTDDIGGLAEIPKLPLTDKDQLRATRTASVPIGTHLAAPMNEVVRIYSTSGTTGDPFFIPLTQQDLNQWIEISSRSYAASGVVRGDKLISTYGAGPFVAGATMDAFDALGVCHIPIGPGNTDRLLAAVSLLRPDAIALTPSYADHLAETAEARGVDLAGSSVKRLLVAGEPGGGEEKLRGKLQSSWGAQVTEAMGIGDISVSLWGECEERNGMHFSGRGFVHFELIESESGSSVPMEDGAKGELVYTHLARQASPVLRFRSRDHVKVYTEPCACGRTAPRVKCVGRTDDMLIVRGVNVFPTAVREVINEFAPSVTGRFTIQPKVTGVKQSPPLPIVVEAKEAGSGIQVLAAKIKERLRERLLFTASVQIVDPGFLPRSSYKTKLIDWDKAEER